MKLSSKIRWAQRQLRTSASDYDFEPRKPKPRSSPSKLPVLEKTCIIEGPAVTCVQTWRRSKGVWHCIASESPLEWMTRVRHVEVAADYLRTHHLSRRWLKPNDLPHTAGTASNPPAEELPAEDYTPNVAREPKGTNSESSQNNPMSAACRPTATSDPERNGLPMPRRLIAEGCPPELSDASK